MNSGKYEYTRTIRFNLSGEDVSVLKPAISLSSKEEALASFYSTFQILLDDFYKVFFYKDKKGEIDVRKRVEIKKEWLRKYARGNFYELSEKDRGRNKFSAHQFSNNLLLWFKSAKEIYNEISEYRSKPPENKTREAELRSLIHGLNSNEYIGFINNLTRKGVLSDKDNDDPVIQLQNSTRQFEESLQLVTYFSASDLSQGVEVGRASFNINTINKISKNFDKDIADKEKEENALYRLNEQQLKILKDVDFGTTDFPLKEFYKKLKYFKSEQKRLFKEAVDKKLSFDQFKLFSTSKEVIEKFKSEKDSKKRGDYFRNKWGFAQYVEYCDRVYKPVAVKYGKLKAEIRSLEQEKIEAGRLKYWSNILEKDGEKFLLLIPKESMKQAQGYIENIQEDPIGEYNSYSFNSLTLRALNKLIRRNLGEVQTRLQNDAINLYKEVLLGKHPELNDINITGFSKNIEAILQHEYDNKEDFRIALEKVAYVCNRKKFNQQPLITLKDEYGALLFKISSYDFERALQGDKKEHSKVWTDFWGEENQAGNFPNRINPEIRLFYRPAREQKELAKQKNRFSKEHFGVAFTISQNAAQKRAESTFAEEKVLVEMVKKFNEEIVGNFVHERGDNLWYFGIDRGTTELATLCIVKFSQEKYQATMNDGAVKEINVPIPAPIKTYRIKKECLCDTKEITVDSSGKKKVVTLFKNPSYFIDDEDKFEEITSPCIDLTTAKLIKGKIVLNGDVQTYLALKKVNGKRQLFEKISKIDPDTLVEFDEEKGQFKIKSREGERKPYQFLPFYRSEHEEVFSREEMRSELQSYLDRLRTGNGSVDEEDVSIEKINHLRDAITSNMVGIISFLFEQYPGIISLENLHGKDDVERHTKGDNENISRRLEWSLYKKFQKHGLVPPKIHQTVLLRETRENKDGLNQFGIIYFVSKEKTSSSCPYCCVHSPQDKDNDKYINHLYTCHKNLNCGFDTRNPKEPIVFIKNSDDVAAYNIAKLAVGVCKNL